MKKRQLKLNPCPLPRLQQPESLQYRGRHRAYSSLVVQVVGETEGFLFFTVAHEDAFGFRRQMRKVIDELASVAVSAEAFDALHLHLH